MKMRKNFSEEELKKIKERSKWMTKLQREALKKKLSGLVKKRKVKRNNAPDPMVNKKADDKKKKLQESQKKARFSAKTIWKNLPVNQYTSNASRAINPWEHLKQKTNRVWGGTKAWPNWETVRKNSKWKYYYINKKGNAVIIKV